MVDDKDIYYSAQNLIDQLGLIGASEHCARRIGRERNKGNDDVAAVWGRIRAALLDLSDVKFDDDTVH